MGSKPKKEQQDKPVEGGIIYPPDERAQHDPIVYGERTSPDGSPAYGARAVTQNPLDRYSVIDLGNLREGGLILQAGGPLARRDLLERGEYPK